MLRLFKDVKRISKDPLRRYWWLKGLFSYKSWCLCRLGHSDADIDEFIWESLNMGYDLEPDYLGLYGWGWGSKPRTVMLNGRRIWIDNFPHASGSYYDNDPDLGLDDDRSVTAFYETRIRLQFLVKRGLKDGTLTALDHTRVKNSQAFSL